MPLGHLLHDNYQTRQFNIRSGQYAIISESIITIFDRQNKRSNSSSAHSIKHNLSELNQVRLELISPGSRGLSG